LVVDVTEINQTTYTRAMEKWKNTIQIIDILDEQFNCYKLKGNELENYYWAEEWIELYINNPCSINNNIIKGINFRKICHEC